MVDNHPSIGFVVTTLGRDTLLRTLLSSMRGQVSDEDHIVIVAQSRFDQVARVAQSFPDLPLTLATSQRGAARGRNVGADLLPDYVSVLHFPSDSTFYPRGSISAIRRESSVVGFRAGGLSVVDAHGPKLEIPPRGTALDRNNLWRVIEMGLVISRADFRQLGGFDDSIGTGATTPWQAGEVSDLLLRFLDAAPALATSFEWFSPTASVGGVVEGNGLTTQERRRKLRAYGRGIGWVARQHSYPLSWKVKRLIGGAAIGILRKKEYGLLDGAWASLGRLEGMLGVTIGRRSQTAVSR